MPSNIPQLRAIGDCRWVSVYREIVRYWQADPILKQVIKGWTTFTGDPADKAATVSGQVPQLTCWPEPANLDYNSEASLAGLLRVVVEVTTGGLNIDDPLNIIDRMIRTLLPGDLPSENVIRNRLVDKGSLTGCIWLDAPKMVEVKEMMAAGQIRMRTAFVTDIQRTIG